MKGKDKVFKNLGASTHTNTERQKDDYYSTDGKAIDFLLKEEELNNNIWECACGNGVLSKKLEEYGYNVYSTDLVDRGYGTPNVDFLKQNEFFDGDILTNPPYKYATEFVLKALNSCSGKVIMFLKILFLESRRRYLEIFKENPPARIYVFSKRIDCYRNGDESNKGGAVCYAWYVWDREHTGDTIIRWLYDESLL